MQDSQKIAIEIVDSMLYSAVGLHFLEPVVTTQVVSKVIPSLVARRKSTIVATQVIKEGKQFKGVRANLPLSQGTKLTADQQYNKELYEKATKKPDKIAVSEREETE